MNAPGAMIAPATARADASLRDRLEAIRVDIMSADELLANAALAAEWDRLSAKAASPNPFAERWYLTAALAALDSGTVQMAVVRDRDLIGIFPFVQNARYAGLPVPHLQNWLNHNAFLGTALVRQHAEERYWMALLAHFDAQGGNALFLHLTGFAITDPVTAALTTVCAREQRRCAVVMHEERALLEKGLSAEAYLEAHVRGKKRKELRRQQKRLGEEGTLTFRRQHNHDGLEQWTTEFLELEMRGWKGSNGSALACSQDTQSLFATVLHGAATAGKLERLDLCLNGRPIAMLANFLTPPGAFSFKTAFDEDYSRFSPGVLLQLENLALLEREGIDWCDSCAAQDHPMIDSLWAGRRAIGRYSVAIGSRAKRAAFSALLTAEMAKAKFKGKVQR
jgi:CelD/BcsL family acetyltransferase involved in cellulose biosynthesis